MKVTCSIVTQSAKKSVAKDVCYFMDIIVSNLMDVSDEHIRAVRDALIAELKQLDP